MKFAFLESVFPIETHQKNRCAIACFTVRADLKWLLFARGSHKEIKWLLGQWQTWLSQCFADQFEAVIRLTGSLCERCSKRNYEEPGNTAFNIEHLANWSWWGIRKIQYQGIERVIGWWIMVHQIWFPGINLIGEKSKC